MYRANAKCFVKMFGSLFDPVGGFMLTPTMRFKQKNTHQSVRCQIGIAKPTPFR
jgi:hypothetical protein